MVALVIKTDEHTVDCWNQIGTNVKLISWLCVIGKKADQNYRQIIALMTHRGDDEIKSNAVHVFWSLIEKELILIDRLNQLEVENWNQSEGNISTRWIQFEWAGTEIWDQNQSNDPARMRTGRGANDDWTRPPSWPLEFNDDGQTDTDQTDKFWLFVEFWRATGQT